MDSKSPHATAMRRWPELATSVQRWPLHHQSQIYAADTGQLPWSLFFVQYNGLFAVDLSITLSKAMNLPLRSYCFSPLNANSNDKLRDHDQLLNAFNVEVQLAQRSDILTTFHATLHDQNKSSLLLFAESLRSDTKQFPLNYNVDMNVKRLSTIYTMNFTNPRLDPNRIGDFSVYFTLETYGAETLVADLALFIRALGRRLIRWSVLGHPGRLGPDDPAHPTLWDLAYCWDGVVCVHGILQFSACDISVMNIRQMFHRTSWICGPNCQAHRCEYVLNGVFLDLDRMEIPSLFTDMEQAARELCDDDAMFLHFADHTAHLPS